MTVLLHRSTITEKSTPGAIPGRNASGLGKAKIAGDAEVIDAGNRSCPDGGRLPPSIELAERCVSRAFDARPLADPSFFIAHR